MHSQVIAQSHIQSFFCLQTAIYIVQVVMVHVHMDTHENGYRKKTKMQEKTNIR